MTAGLAFLVVVAITAGAAHIFDTRMWRFSDTQRRTEASGPSRSAKALNDADADMLSYLKASQPSQAAADGLPGTTEVSKLLLDVTTMIDRLAARMETTPDDVKGWKTLGWSYEHTGDHERAAAAYARALALAPTSAELEAAYDDARSKALQSDRTATTRSGAGSAGVDGSQNQTDARPGAAPPRDHTSEIRSMVDGLARRLESQPHDADGWARLMRSRIVLGETDLALATFRKALHIFKDDATVTDGLTVAARELGLHVP